MKTLPLLFSLGVLSSSLSAQTGGWTFTDDFQAGAVDYGQWTEVGRDLSNTGVIDVVPRGGSLAGHVYHSSFTETTLVKEFAVTPGFTLDFDMEVRATAPGSPGSAYNSFAGAWIEVYGGAERGRLEVIYCTSSYRQTVYNPDPKVEVLQLAPNTNQHHTFTLADIYAYLPGVDPAAITNVRLAFWSYCSWWNGSANGDVWFDNLVAQGLAATLDVTPAPPTAGARATFRAFGLRPGRSAFLFFSTQGPGTTPLTPLGLTLDIAGARPATLLSRVPPGEASWTLPIPASAAGHTWWMQAAQAGLSTRVLEVAVQ